MNDYKKGFLLLAFNNIELDYTKMALCCALSIKNHLIINHITLITDKNSMDWLNQSIDSSIIKKAFDNIQIIDQPIESNNRRHYDSPWTKFKAPFLNSTRSSAYDFSPYEETILIDVDYLIMSNSLDLVWGNKEDLLINKDASTLRYEKFSSNEIKLNKSGISMYWATLIYFKKTELSNLLFNMIDFIKDHYLFYKHLYKFPGSLYRNDYSFSIAIHILNGFLETDNIKSFPISTIKTMDQKDDIVEVGKDNILFLNHNPKKYWENILVNLKNIDVHIMNKRAFIRHSDSLIKAFL